jgi:hypothetical protein
VRSIQWIAAALATGAALGAGASVVNNVPLLLGEVGKARADRSGWSQTAEFASLILDSGWAWAATAVAVGWLVTRGIRPMVGAIRGALAGCVALLAATVVYNGVDLLFTGDFGWSWVVRFWLVASLVLGLPLGAVGATMRRPGPAGVLAALVVPVGAGLNMVVLPPPKESPVAELVLLTVWCAAVTATVMVVVRVVRVRRRGNRGSGAVVAAGALDDNAGGVVTGS